MELKKIIIIGAGTMGQGIAQWFTQQNLEVELVDLNYDFAQESLKKIFQSFDKLKNSGKLEADAVESFKKKIYVKKMNEIDSNADLVIEAIIEKMEAKTKLFSDLDLLMKKNTILASNTSSFSITQLAANLSLERQSRFIGIHFFNPATIMKLVEVIKGIETDSDLATSLIDWFNQRKKIACLCSDSPGFIVNRVARNFYGEALRAAGNFDPEKFSEIDSVLKEVGGFKMGPFELMDLIGIDINFSVTQSIYDSTFQEVRFKPHSLQRDMVNARRLGRKTGKGFYSYESKE